MANGSTNSNGPQHQRHFGGAAQTLVDTGAGAHETRQRATDKQIDLTKSSPVATGAALR